MSLRPSHLTSRISTDTWIILLVIALGLLIPFSLLETIAW
jgi:hypothetical protein